jgi:endo-1,4-beta-xylanase
MLEVLQSIGYRNVHWDVVAQDWENSQTAAAVQEAVLEGIRSHGDGAIVLLHTWPAPTLEALPGIIQELRTLATSFVTVAEL